MVKRELHFDPNPPEDFDPEHPYADPVAFVEMKQWIVREKLIGIERAKLIREQVKLCYRREGVNHLKNCRKYYELYMETCKHVGWQGEWKKNVEDFRPKKRPEKPVLYA